jgi:hypothetical protein
VQPALTVTIVPVSANADVAGHLHHAVAGDARPVRLSPNRMSTACAVTAEHGEGLKVTWVQVEVISTSPESFNPREVIPQSVRVLYVCVFCVWL